MVLSKQNTKGKDPAIIQFPVPRGTCDMSAHGALSFAGIRLMTPASPGLWLFPAIS